MENAQPYKILLFNANYWTGLDGSFRNYLLHFLRYLHTPMRTQKRVAHSLKAMIDQEQPDLCCFVEIRRSNRLPSQLEMYPFHDVDNKYGEHSIFRHLPFFRNNCNGFFSKESIPYRKHFLRDGMKKLIYEVKLNADTSLLFCHFALTAHARRKQFANIEEILKKRKSVILCGDFNIFRGTKELESLMKAGKLRILNGDGQATFPTKRPRKDIDLFLCSTGISVGKVTVLDHMCLSDHLPVMLEVRLK